MHRKKIEIPLIGLGTYELLGRICTQTVSLALELGYRHIDTAHFYDNHKAVGKAIADIPRHDLFLTSKFTVDQISDRSIEKSVRKSCEKALKELKTDFLDLYLLHWPSQKRPYIDMVAAMQPLVSDGLIRAFGVSNCTIHHLSDLHAQNITPQVNQVEFHPYLNQKELLNFCKKHAIVLEAYRPFGKGALLTDPLFQELAQQHSKTPAQVLLRYCVQKEISVIPKSRSEKHLKDNLDIFDFSLTPQEMEILDAQPEEKRFCVPDWEEFNY